MPFCSAQFNILASLHITSLPESPTCEDRLYRHFRIACLFSIESFGWFDENQNISFNSVPRRNSANSQENFTSLTFQSFPTSLFRWPFTSLQKSKSKKYFKEFLLALHIAGKHISSKYFYRNTLIKKVEIAWLSLCFILETSWVALYSVVCEWVSVWGIGNTRPNLHFFQYI